MTCMDVQPACPEARIPAARHAHPVLLVTCRYCLRPLALVAEIDEQERAALHRHVLACAPGAALSMLDDADVHRHFRVVDA